MSHIRTYFRHRLDFIRQASVNSAVLTPYTGDIVCIRARPPTLFAGSFNIDYARLAVTAFPELGGYSIVDLVEKGDVDMVWVTAAPDGCNFHENALVGNQDINPNVTGEKWNPAPAKCSRSFFVNAYLADARSWDAYAHMVEGILTTMSDGYPANWPADFACQVYTKNRSDFTTAYPAHLRLFERFRLTDVWNGAGAYASSGNGNCGSSHYPPTARRDVSGRYDGNYAYYDLKTWQRYIDCGADDWLRFPEFTGARRKLNGYDFGGFNNYLENEASYAKAFGASPELHSSFRFATDSYHLWWFFHLPHNRGVTNGKLNNWWPYLFDFNRFKGNAITYPVDGFPDTAAMLTPVNGEYGTESESADLWGYWHSCSDFGPNGRATVADRTRTPDLVRSGRYALHVAVELESFQHEGRNDLVFPIGKNARWDMSQARAIRVAVKLIAGASQILGVNPLLRLCANGGNRLELVPVRNGVYANFLNDNRFRDADGWQIFEIPISGSPDWEANVIGYLDPSLGPADLVTARQELKRRIVAEVNYIEVSIRSEGGRGNSLVYCVDDLEIVGTAASN